MLSSDTFHRTMCVSCYPQRQFWYVHNRVENCHAVHWIWVGFSRHRQWHHHSSHPDSASSQVTLTPNVTQNAHEHTMPWQTTYPRGYLCRTGLHSQQSQALVLSWLAHILACAMSFVICRSSAQLSAVCHNGVHYCGQSCCSSFHRIILVASQPS